MSVSFISAGTGTSGISGDVTAPGMPANVTDNDILIYHVVSRDASTFALPAGWNLVAWTSFDATSTTWVAWRRFVAADTIPGVVRTGTTDAFLARVTAWRGALVASSPITASTIHGVPTGGRQIPFGAALTPPVGAMLLALGFHADNVTGAAAGYTNTNSMALLSGSIGTWTEAYEGSTVDGLDASQVCDYISMDIDAPGISTGTSGTIFLLTDGTSVQNQGMYVAIQPEPETNVPAYRNRIEKIGGSRLSPSLIGPGTDYLLHLGTSTNGRVPGRGIFALRVLGQQGVADAPAAGGIPITFSAVPAIATASNDLPTLRVRSTATFASAIASAQVPAALARVFPPISSASAVGQIPVGQVKTTPVQASASAAGQTPTLRARLNSVGASASAVGNVPTPTLRFSSVQASATAPGNTPTERILVRPPTAIATAIAAPNINPNAPVLIKSKHGSRMPSIRQNVEQEVGRRRR